MLRRSFGSVAAVALVACTSAGPREAVGQSTTSAISTGDVIARAEEWVSAQVPYCQSANHQPDSDPSCASVCDRPDNAEWDPYRSDCSGFVSWAWGLPAPGLSTSGFAPADTSVSYVIDGSQLAPGDALNIPGDHIVLFKQWTVQGQEATFLEEPGCSAATPYAHEFTSSLSVSGSSVTIAYEGSTFTAIRFASISTGPATSNPSAPTSAPPSSSSGSSSSGGGNGSTSNGGGSGNGGSASNGGSSSGGSSPTSTSSSPSSGGSDAGAWGGGGDASPSGSGGGGDASPASGGSGAPCASDSDCQSGLVCSWWTCTDPNAGGGDAGPAGNDAAASQDDGGSFSGGDGDPCSTDDDCALGLSCQGGVCSSGDDSSGSQDDGTACSSDGDCNPGGNGTGQMCVSGQCVDGCDADWECPGVQTCQSGQCM